MKDIHKKSICYLENYISYFWRVFRGLEYKYGLSDKHYFLLYMISTITGHSIIKKKCLRKIYIKKKKHIFPDWFLVYDGLRGLFIVIANGHVSNHEKELSLG